MCVFTVRTKGLRWVGGWEGVCMTRPLRVKTALMEANWRQCGVSIAFCWLTKCAPVH